MSMLLAGAGLMFIGIVIGWALALGASSKKNED